jgi:hypothetical protein
MSRYKKVIPFLYYVKNGECKPNNKMPLSGEQFWGWLTASHVIRNQSMHKSSDIEACLAALREFVDSLETNQEISEKDLLNHI